MLDQDVCSRCICDYSVIVVFSLDVLGSLCLDLFVSIDDCIGIAVDLWSEVTVTRSDKFEITAEGEGAEEMPKDDSNYMVVGCKAAFEAAGKPLPTLKYHVVSRIPYARGLGSSSAAIVAGIVAGLVLAGHRLPCWGSEALLQIAAGIEVRYTSAILSSGVPVKTLKILFSVRSFFFFRATLTMWRQSFTAVFS